MRRAVRRCPEPRTATRTAAAGAAECPPQVPSPSDPAARWPRRADTDRTERPPSRNRHRRWCPPPVNSTGCRTPRRTRPPQRRRRRWPSCGSGPDTDRRCGTGRGHPRYTRSGQRAGRCPPAQRPADMPVEAAAEGPQRFRPGGGNGTGCRTPDRSRSHPAWTPIRPPDDVAAQDRTPEAADGQSADRPRLWRITCPVCREEA
jgi:hypothetical protein